MKWKHYLEFVQAEAMSSSERRDVSYIQINMYLEVVDGGKFGVMEGKQWAVGERVLDFSAEERLTPKLLVLTLSEMFRNREVLCVSDKAAKQMTLKLKRTSIDSMSKHLWSDEHDWEWCRPSVDYRSPKLGSHPLGWMGHVIHIFLLAIAELQVACSKNTFLAPACVPSRWHPVG